ncbi:MAG: PsbP-related protein [Dehalococcoidales bacterium]
MKKFTFSCLLILFTLILTISVIGCESKTSTSETGTPPSTPVSTTPTPTPTPTPTTTTPVTSTTVPASSPTVPEGFKLYTNSTHGISFFYPDNWHQLGLTGYTDSLWKTAFEEPLSRIAPGVGIIKYDMGGKMLKDFHEKKIVDLSVFGSREVLLVEHVTINGLDAYITTFSEKSSQGPIKGMDMTITKDNKLAYCVDCYCLLSDYDKNEKNFDMIFNSFKIQ